MEIDSAYIKKLIMLKQDNEVEESLKLGWDPNVGRGWPIRLAARYGCYTIVEILIRYGANPHLLSESGASTLQLAVYSGEHWDSNCWTFLLSCCDSSQLADGAAVAIIFNNGPALKRIFETGRCNTHIPTTLTGKTLEQLAKGYKMTNLLSSASLQAHSPNNRPPYQSPSTSRPHRSLEVRSNLRTQHHPQRNLSPSVARFFEQTAHQASLTSPRMSVMEGSPNAQYTINN